MTVKCDKCGKEFSHPTRANQALAAHRRSGTACHEEQAGGEAPKRKYRKSKNQEIILRFCPCCGLDMSVLSTAFEVAKLGLK